jgi:hypothetical protein
MFEAIVPASTIWHKVTTPLLSVSRVWLKSQTGFFHKPVTMITRHRRSYTSLFRIFIMDGLSSTIPCISRSMNFSPGLAFSTFAHLVASAGWLTSP